MKVVIAYPPLESDKGVPLLSQNRQFQYFKEPTFIYPVVPAQAATLLEEQGHEVIWLDGIAANMKHGDFFEKVNSLKADLIAMETKTPVIKQHWQIINDLKRQASGWRRPATLLFGDHVTALPQESFQQSEVDFVLTGGDYDFLLLNLCNYLSGDLAKCSVDETEDVQWNLSIGREGLSLEPGIWYRNGTEIKNTGAFKLNHNLDDLPFINRDLTNWHLYAYKNGNYKNIPGTYIMSGRDCWWARCKFCSWPTLYPKFRVRSVNNVLDEITMLVERYNVKEIMDDTGTFPVGGWFEAFCDGMVARGLHKKVTLDCNMRFQALSAAQYKKMREAGFRLILFGLESANQKTLDRLDKDLTVDGIVTSCRMARSAGLYPHITIMFGYPWESYEEAANTLKLGKWLLKKDYAYTVQATIVIPYPGSPLFMECQRQGCLKTQDWDDYDMKSPVMECPIDEAKICELVQGIYKVAFSPEFIFNRLRSARSLSDLTYFGRGAKKVFGHIFDFRK